MACPVHDRASTLAVDMGWLIVPVLVERGSLPPFVSKQPTQLERRLTTRLRSMFEGVDDEIVRQLGQRVPPEHEINAIVARATAARILRMREAAAESAVESAVTARERVLREMRQHREIARTPMSDRVRRRIFDRELQFADESMNAISDDIKSALVKAHRDGVGIDKAASDYLKPVTEGAEGRLKTTARTVIQGSQNDIRHDTMAEAGIALEQWITALDARVRGRDPKDMANHVMLHGEVSKTGENFSNGLRYPSDRGGPIEEWINCRCHSRPYFPGPNEVITSTPFVA